MAGSVIVAIILCWVIAYRIMISRQAEANVASQAERRRRLAPKIVRARDLAERHQRGEPGEMYREFRPLAGRDRLAEEARAKPLRPQKRRHPEADGLDGPLVEPE